MVFVEVKSRDGRAFGQGAEAVTGLKRHRMTQLALDYLTRHRLTNRPCRFDVVSIDFESEPPGLELYQNAFESSS
jgi:putative endonuclease